jgi:hypothetical protein
MRRSGVRFPLDSNGALNFHEKLAEGVGTLRATGFGVALGEQGGHGGHEGGIVLVAATTSVPISAAAGEDAIYSRPSIVRAT